MARLTPYAIAAAAWALFVAYALRFTADALPRGLQVAFIAFGHDEQLDRAVTDYTLRRVRWRD